MAVPELDYCILVEVEKEDCKWPELGCMQELDCKLELDYCILVWVEKEDCK